MSRRRPAPRPANALLKLLEEPPDGTRFILTSGKPGSLLETVRSRALPIHLPPLATSEVAGFLEEECGADLTAAQRAAVLAQGSIGAALGYLDREGFQAEQRRGALKLLRIVTGGKRAEAFKAALEFGPREPGDSWTSWARCSCGSAIWEQPVSVRTSG